jgi:ferric-dicitrate binding protein FerR (iron transport regulator)
MSEQRIAYLFHQCLQGHPSPEERKELLEYAADPGYRALFESYMEKTWDNVAIREVFNEAEQDAMIDYTISKAAVEDEKPKLRKLTWLRVAAAILLLIMGVGVYVAFYRNSPKGKVPMVNKSPIVDDVLPGSDKAILTLSNGQRLSLNDTSTATIKDGSLDIKNKNGQLSYIGARVVTMNMVSTPNGGQYKLTLADGTKVWLNASSSISYPTAFKKATREVSVTGEVYFEVSPNKQQPFIVKTRGEEIKVLGTRFNVNTYENEPESKTSLVEGSVSIGNKILKPGQAYVNGKVITTDLDQDLSWKNGYFNFAGTDLPTLMRQFERWYDIKVSYEGKAPAYKFHGELDRGLKLSEVLEILSEQGVKYTFKEKTLIISP